MSGLTSSSTWDGLLFEQQLYFTPSDTLLFYNLSQEALFTQLIWVNAEKVGDQYKMINIRIEFGILFLLHKLELFFFQWKKFRIQVSLKSGN